MPLESKKNPESNIVEYSDPSSGISIRLQINRASFKGISPKTKNTLALTLGSFARSMAFICDAQNGLENAGISVETASKRINSALYNATSKLAEDYRRGKRTVEEIHEDK
jgi:hypothetical protein